MQRIILISVALFIFLSQSVSAHTSGVSLEQVAGKYVIDIGYDPAVPLAGQYTNFDFTLKDSSTGDYSEFDHVWVRIEKDDATLLAMGIAHQDLGPTTLLYAFSAPGEYQLSASYRTREGTEIAHAQFPLEIVGSGESGTKNMQFIWIGFGVLAGLALVFIVARFRG